MKVGDVVRLKSGGPWMTVRRLKENGGCIIGQEILTNRFDEILTNWFDEGLLRGEFFAEDQLELQLCKAKFASGEQA
jgi:uncharacterized protein YodC (DUF2158 family)